jgi:hypothetical protein
MICSEGGPAGIGVVVGDLAVDRCLQVDDLRQSGNGCAEKNLSIAFSHESDGG